MSYAAAVPISHRNGHLRSSRQLTRGRPPVSTRHDTNATHAHCILHFIRSSLDTYIHPQRTHSGLSTRLIINTVYEGEHGSHVLITPLPYLCAMPHDPARSCMVAGPWCRDSRSGLPASSPGLVARHIAFHAHDHHPHTPTKRVGTVCRKPRSCCSRLALQDHHGARQRFDVSEEDLPVRFPWLGTRIAPIGRAPAAPSWRAVAVRRTPRV